MKKFHVLPYDNNYVKYIMKTLFSGLKLITYKNKSKPTLNISWCNK